MKNTSKFSSLYFRKKQSQAKRKKNSYQTFVLHQTADKAKNYIHLEIGFATT